MNTDVRRVLPHILGSEVVNTKVNYPRLQFTLEHWTYLPTDDAQILDQDESLFGRGVCEVC